MSDEEPTLADFDLDAWIDGTTGITGVARILQRGDLLAKRDRLAAELETTRKVGAKDRGVEDRSPKQIEDELDQCYQDLWDSMLWVHVQDRTADRRSRLAKEMDEAGADNETIGFALIADAIVKAETAAGRQVPLSEGGFGGARLRAIRDRAGDAALIELNRVYQEVTASAPAVQAPLSHAPSSTTGGNTSRSGSGRRNGGRSRR